MNDDYSPIPCGLHSEYELLAMRRARVVLVHVDERGQEQQLQGRVEDVFTRQGAEYLRLALAGGEIVDLRLDRIRM
ncbi:transcriptional antiterminator, Rof [Thiolapillus sp.]